MPTPCKTKAATVIQWGRICPALLCEISDDFRRCFGRLGAGGRGGEGGMGQFRDPQSCLRPQSPLWRWRRLPSAMLKPALLSHKRETDTHTHECYTTTSPQLLLKVWLSGVHEKKLWKVELPINFLPDLSAMILPRLNHHDSRSLWCDSSVAPPLKARWRACKSAPFRFDRPN